MAKWASKNPNPNTKSGLDLMQNCDLPPPSKIFTGPDKSVLTSMNRIFNNVAVADEEEESDEINGIGDEKLELLKALRLSQTRAREAEKKAAGLAKERDFLRNALMEDSLKLFAYRQWVKLLEFELVGVEREKKKDEGVFCEEGDCEGGGGGMGGQILSLVGSD
ncbi:hypothetical protein RHMOL_Rhmol10G0248900 [Rhododendron molle]|uniref:Uncharacterized protein n=1 Tax=Rhododendron molle TaxID=49168 RepID=A0ACC0M7E0_RHOML|nr:hypothetical protein RHMOL_Rhmol10G0248900 [Rhododendron molle]